MPLLNIGGATNNNMTIQVAVCFLSEESEPDYDWAMEQLFNCITDQKVRQPRTIITDRELAFINAIVKRFQFFKHILCQQHISQNVYLKAKLHFPALKKLKKRKGLIVLNKKFLEFMNEWRQLLQSLTEAEYEKRLYAFEMISKYLYKAIRYTIGWLD